MTVDRPETTSETYEIITCNGEVFKVKTELLLQAKYFRTIIEDEEGWLETTTKQIKVPQQGSEFRVIYNILLYGDELLECYKCENASTKFMLKKNLKYFGLSEMLVSSTETWDPPPKMDIRSMTFVAAVGGNHKSLKAIIQSDLCTKNDMEYIDWMLKTELRSSTPRIQLVYSILHVGILPDVADIPLLISFLLSSDAALDYFESTDVRQSCEILRSLNKVSPGCLRYANANGDTLLHKMKAIEVIQTLARIPGGVNMANASGRTPIFYHLHDKDITELLIQNGCHVKHAVDKSRRNVLHSMNLSTEVLQLLVANGADVNMLDADGNAPIHFHLAVDELKLLIENGADPSISNFKGETPLHLATSEETVSVLLDNEVEVNPWTMLGRTPLHYPKTPAAVELLLKAGSFVNATSYTGETPLHLNSDGDVVKQLLLWGANPKACTDTNKETPLHFHKDANAVEALVEAGADVNAVTYYGTPLFCQVSGESTEALLRMGADPKWSTTSGETPLHVTRDGESVRALIRAGVNIRAQTISGFTPLHRQESVEAVVALISAGANVHVTDSYGETPLHRAKDGGAVRALIKAGCSVSAASVRGTTPLHAQRSQEAVAALIEAGASVQCRDLGGNTVLHSDKEYNAVIDLVNAGANPFTPNQACESPFDYATAARNSEVSAAISFCQQHFAS